MQDLDWLPQDLVVLALAGLADVAIRLPTEVALLEDLLNEAIGFQAKYRRRLEVIALVD